MKQKEEAVVSSHYLTLTFDTEDISEPLASSFKPTRKKSQTFYTIQFRPKCLFVTTTYKDTNEPQNIWTPDLTAAFNCTGTSDNNAYCF